MLLSYSSVTRYTFVCFLGMLCLWAGVCRAQESNPPKVKPDTTLLPAATDTTQKFDERIMNNLRQMSERKTIMGKLLKAILVFDRVDENFEGMDAELIRQEYEKHNYKIVRHIDILSLDPFGYSISDTARVPQNFFEKAGNALHVKTGRGLIRNKLLFEAMEPLEPLALVESERLLRQTSYLLDARIIVNEQTTTDDSVDVFVITKDIFSLGGSGSFSASSGSGRISLRELNFLGQGHQLRTSYRFNMDRPRPWELSGAYAIENIGKSYISADINYINENYYKEKSAFLRRDFYSTNTKYAGAAGFISVKERLLLPAMAEDTVARYGDLSYTRHDAWLGRAFQFKSYNLGYESRGRVIAGLRVVDTDYHTTPTNNFQDNTLLLGSLGYSIRKYYKDRYLFGFGRTEDIPAGALVTFTMGYEKGALTNRRYVGASASVAKYSKDFGYLYGSVNYGTFLHDGQGEQGVLELQSLYFTKLYEWGNWKLRHYAQGRATFGINRHAEELLSINNEDGLRGFRSDLLRGTRRVSLNYEANFYTPLSLFGFRLAAVAFADVAWLSMGNKSSPFREAPYSGYGIGIRLRNEYLGFSTIQFLVGYYPRLPGNEDLRSIKTLGSTRLYYDFTDFRFLNPSVAEFR
ncbi:hypothetical protein I2I11_01815 [Pontibacter sp. 172403-2]|uniref:hypothetical protein n=1 Tax=Pontibacter rufus TaxID=2791028 RepID=UPI0018AFA335|nr:hypothetical protein [Pontibacter sp. 172403-2]MBF9252021.1 hypothetical protein [Pontibacter sp. 172403-2]